MKKLILFISTDYDKKRINKNFYNGTYNHLFDEIKIYNENNLPKCLIRKIKTIKFKYGKKGMGYWIWKPYILYKELLMSNYNDIIVHLDAHCFLENIENKINDYFELLKTMDKPLLIGHCWIYNDMQFSTKKLIEYVENELNYKFSIDELTKPQLEAGIIFMRKTEFVISIIKRWDYLMHHGIEYATDIYNNDKNNYSCFIDNRHDQSMLSLLCKANHIYAYDEFDWDILNRVNGKQISYEE